MGKQIRIRPVTIVLLLVALVLVVLYQNSLRGPTLPPGGRTKLPIGPVKPMVSLGATHGLILAGDGSLWTWGSDFLGWPVLGLGTNSTNVQTSLRRIGKDTNWFSINAGEDHSLAVKSDGSMWAWGENIYGQFGNGTKLPSSANAPVPAAPGSDWKAAAAGGAGCSLGLKRDGTLWAWGNNWAGQLGIDSTNDSLAPTQIGTGTNWVRVWASGLHGAALQSDGSLWVWGYNPFLTNQPVRSSSNFLTPVCLAPGSKWSEATFNGDVLLAIRSDGTLWAWGRNAPVYTGQSNSVSITTLARVGTTNGWKSCTASQFTEYVVLEKKDGSVWVLSAPFFPTIGSARLTELRLNKEIVAAAGGGGGGHGAVLTHDSLCTGVALTRDGEVWTWGKMLGNHTPAPIYLRALAKAGRVVHLKNNLDDPVPVLHEEPWLLPNIDPMATPPK